MKTKCSSSRKKINLWQRQSFSALWLTRNAGRPWQNSDGELIWVWIQRLECNNTLITTILILYRKTIFYIIQSFNFVIITLWHVEALHVMTHFTLWCYHSSRIFRKRFFFVLTSDILRNKVINWCGDERNKSLHLPYLLSHKNITSWCCTKLTENQKHSSE